jgi:competence protein ComFC
MGVAAPAIGPGSGAANREERCQTPNQGAPPPGVPAPQPGAGSWLTGIASALLGVVFPAECRICQQMLTTASRLPICEECLGGIRPIDEEICGVCGGITGEIATHDGERLLCRRCRDPERQNFAFDRAISWSFYEGPLVRAILLLKFEQIEPLGELFGRMLAGLVAATCPALEADVVVPVPLHRERQRERGYNQAAVIAKPLAKRLGIAYKPILLSRIRPRPDKHILSLEERWESVRGAFATRPGSVVDNLRVLLVDDVLTTGATLDSCARALRDAGAKSVVGLTVARAVAVRGSERPHQRSLSGPAGGPSPK